jgi:hypothetical protein
MKMSIMAGILRVRSDAVWRHDVPDDLDIVSLLLLFAFLSHDETRLGLGFLCVPPGGSSLLAIWKKNEKLD